MTANKGPAPPASGSRAQTKFEQRNSYSEWPSIAQGHRSASDDVRWLACADLMQHAELLQSLAVSLREAARRMQIVTIEATLRQARATILAAIGAFKISQAAERDGSPT